MKIRPTLEECMESAAGGKYGVIPVSMEVDIEEGNPLSVPIEILKILKRVSGHVYLLESAEPDKKWGRYSFLGYDPLMEITCYNGTSKIKTALTTQETTQDIRSCIRGIVEENRSPQPDHLPPFTGGLVGYFSYDYIKYSEPSLKLDARDEEGFQDVNLMLFHKVIVFDNSRKKIILIVNCKTDDTETNYHKAALELESMRQLIQSGEKASDVPLKLKSDFRPLFNEEEYCRMVQRGKDYIKEGDIFQVVLSNRLEAEMEGSLLDAYRIQYQMTASIEPDVKVIRNDGITVEGIDCMAPSHIILSPGPGNPRDAGICEDVIRHLPGTSGNLRGVRGDSYPCRKADAR